MGYQVKKTSGSYKILWVTNGKAKYLPREMWSGIGVSPTMTIEEARRRISQVNALAQREIHEQRRVNISKRLQAEKEAQFIFLNEHDILEFEKTKLTFFTAAKTHVYWNQARRILIEVKLEPKDWEDNRQVFYKAFIKFGMSPAYVQKVLPILNKWGAFLAKKYGQAFLPLPPPRDHWANKISEAHYDKPRSRGNKESAPLTSDALEKCKDKLKPEQYRFLYLSVWFGLRPIEIDSLSEPSSKRTWYITEVEGTQILWVYQSKLKGLSPEKRTKGIPCITPEQVAGLAFLGKPLKRPIAKVMLALFGGHVTLYGGRKGFDALMQQLGQNFEDVSQWLGHQDINQTYAAYRNKRTVRFKKVA